METTELSAHIARMHTIVNPSRAIRLYIGATQHIVDIYREDILAADWFDRWQNLQAVALRRWQALTIEEQEQVRDLE